MQEENIDITKYFNLNETDMKLMANLLGGKQNKINKNDASNFMNKIQSNLIFNDDKIEDLPEDNTRDNLLRKLRSKTNQHKMARCTKSSIKHKIDNKNKKFINNVKSNNIENNIVENNIVENNIVENNIVENNIVENNIVENNSIENNVNRDETIVEEIIDDYLLIS